MDLVRFPFRRSAWSLLSLPFGVVPGRSYVDVDDQQLVIRYGPWCLTTPLRNIESAQITGPYRWWKVAGPARLSASDLGVTFASATDAGVCIRFHEPVAAIAPGHAVHHPGATVTVESPEDLVHVLSRAACPA